MFSRLRNLAIVSAALVLFCAVPSSADNVAIGGPFTAMPTPSANGTLVPSGPNGVRIYLACGGSASVTYTIAASAPQSAPALTATVTSTNNCPWVDENVAAGNGLYVTASSGGAFYRQM